MKRDGNITKLGTLTAREYGWLKNQPVLTPEELEKVKEYENIKPSVDLANKRRRDKLIINTKLIWQNFLPFYTVNERKPFNQTPDATANIAPIIKYFAKDPEFVNCERLVKRVGQTDLEVSLDKGLLIVGSFGNGKTSIMRALSRMFNHYQMPMAFKSVNAHDIVTEFESINNPGDKDLFYERYKCKALHIDDVKKEQKASNYGVLEVIRVILEKRYDAGLTTFITCNYREKDHTQSLDDALVEFGDRYGEHIYDRLFQMFNIIEFKGKSFR